MPGGAFISSYKPGKMKLFVAFIAVAMLTSLALSMTIGPMSDDDHDSVSLANSSDDDFMRLGNGGDPPGINFIHPQDGYTVSVPFILLWGAHNQTHDFYEHEYRFDDGEWIGVEGMIPVVIVDAMPTGNYDLTVRSSAPDGNQNQSTINIDVVDTEPIDWTEINDLNDLNDIRNNLSGNYRLMNDIDASATSDPTSPSWNDGAGFLPFGKTLIPNTLGDISDIFSGRLDGNGHTISGLFIDSDVDDTAEEFASIGLFSGLAPGGQIFDLVIDDADVSGRSFAGILVGTNIGGFINGCSVSGELNSTIGGAISAFNFGSVKDCISNANTDGQGATGGLIGANVGFVGGSYATGDVSSYFMVGGLIGLNRGTVEDSFATGDLNGTYQVGGLIGLCISGSIERSFATGNVEGLDYVGGLLGASDEGTIKQSYATGSVNGNTSIGGLIGYSNSTVTETYATGNVSGNTSVGGLIGKNDGSVSSSYWDKDSTGLTYSNGSLSSFGKTTAQMMQQDTYSGWDFDGIWYMEEGSTYPMLQTVFEPNPCAGEDRTIDEGMVVNFNGSASVDEVGIVNYTWTFTYDGQLVKLYGESPTFQFDIPGNYTVTLTVKNAAGNQGVDTMNVTVNPSESDDEVCIGVFALIAVGLFTIPMLIARRG